MNVSYRWLRDFVDCNLSPIELRDLLTARCATVEDVIALRQDLAGIVVGRVVEAARHPNSEHLWVTKVDAGDGVLHDVVCGAPNVKAGTLYPFAPVGAVLPGGLRIEKRKIRGEVSEGMLCSARELGLGTDHEGILALDVQAEPGARFLDVMPAGDTRLVVDVLPNRPDLLSHHGLAREIAAATGAELHHPHYPPAVLTHAVPPTTTPSVTVTVADTEGAPRYMTATIRGVQVGPSPEWLASRVEAIGARSISNVVDVTNYMLHGFGQPMHAFDLAKLGGGKVVVRRATKGERLVTLDGVERELDDNMTVIADAAHAQAIAGVIGGKGSEVSADTRDILLEVAAFDPRRIRATRRKLGVSTDASYRFERGVDREAIPDLVKYAAELITRVAGGVLEGTPTDSIQPRETPQSIHLRPSRVARVLGEEIPADGIERFLESVGFAVTRERDEMVVTPPSFRADVTGEIELIEEIARLHGYDAFSSEIRPFRPGTVPDAPLELVSRRVRSELIAAGLLETRPMPFVREGPESHRVRNPLAEDEAYLRASVLDSLARRAEYNFAHMQRNIRLFEIGTVFTTEREAASGAPVERTHAAAVVTGDRRPAHFTEPRPPHYDEWDAKGLAEAIAGVAYPDAAIQCSPSVGDALWTVSADGTTVGTVSRLVLDAPVWATPVFGVEIDLPATATGASEKRYTAIANMPAIEVDLALLVPDEITSALVAEAIRGSAGDLLESLDVFDEFRGAGVEAGTRSLAWRLTFRHPERTLRDREIQGRTAKILGTLESTLGIRQRTS
ncbi:MAG: phenylalanine--tRNA ligase subunit beta [Gemmatimonadaceae bacterium]|nr:phenylalanine--tRNA ligase subunit beta [Gemmatimonadaceae bacterium]